MWHGYHTKFYENSSNFSERFEENGHATIMVQEAAFISLKREKGICKHVYEGTAMPSIRG
jgi:hypothetical protein